ILSKLEEPSDEVKNDLLNALMPKNAQAHNSIYRGKDLTEYFTSGEMSKAILAGTFDDIFIGDYIKKSVTIDGTEYKDVIWRVGDIDYNLNRGYTNQTVHHVLMVPDVALGTAQMNSTDTSAGGYQGSVFWNNVIPKYTQGIVTAFGTDHVLEHTELLTNALNADTYSAVGNSWKGSAYMDWSKGSTGKNGHPWATVKANIFNAIMMFGSALGSSYRLDYSCNKQIALFRYGQNFVTGTWCWLRDVTGATRFAGASSDGNVGSVDASNSSGVRVYFLLH
ncbi:hypothetical protein, partial [Mitsuokella sp.]|uniref:hypothetical protein n=1 Tax=Mitsuokella sp. TaxID=2049034 RepID=UPI003D7EE92A